MLFNATGEWRVGDSTWTRIGHREQERLLVLEVEILVVELGAVD